MVKLDFYSLTNRLIKVSVSGQWLSSRSIGYRPMFILVSWLFFYWKLRVKDTHAMQRSLRIAWVRSTLSTEANFALIVLSNSELMRLTQSYSKALKLALRPSSKLQGNWCVRTSSCCINLKRNNLTILMIVYKTGSSFWAAKLEK